MWGFPSPQQPSPALHGCPLILQAPWFCDSSPITHPFTFQAIATFCDSCISIVTQQASFGLEDLTQSNPLWWLSRCQCVTVCCHSVPQGPLASLQFLDAMKKASVNIHIQIVFMKVSHGLPGISVTTLNGILLQLFTRALNNSCVNI